MAASIRSSGSSTPRSSSNASASSDNDDDSATDEQEEVGRTRADWRREQFLQVYVEDDIYEFNVDFDKALREYIQDDVVLFEFPAYVEALEFEAEDKLRVMWMQLEHERAAVEQHKLQNDLHQQENAKLRQRLRHAKKRLRAQRQRPANHDDEETSEADYEEDSMQTKNTRKRRRRQ